MTRLDSAQWRKLAWWGAARGPRFWLRLSPGPIGLVAAAVSPRQRDHVRANLRALYGRRTALVEHVDVARTFVHFAQNLAESLALQGDKQRMPVVRVFGDENLQRVIEGGTGVILGTAHTSGWEAALVALERFSSIPVLVAMRPEREVQARAFHPVSKQTDGRRVVAVGDDPLSSLPLLQHLRRGGCVAMQADRCVPGMRSLEVEAGRKTWTMPEGLFALAGASGAPIVLALSSRTGFLSYDLRISGPIHVGRGKEQGRAAAQKVARELARHVYAQPTQWFDFRPA